MHLMSDLIRADERFPWSTRGGDGDMQMRERDLRARNRMEQLLADHGTILQASTHELMPFGRIVDLCGRLWKSADVSVPACSEGVPVCSQAESLPACGTLFVLGMLEGVFPRRRREDPVLTDRERVELTSLLPHLAPLPTSHDMSRRERGAFYKVCAAARERICFSYPSSNDQRDNIRAFYLEAAEVASQGHCAHVTFRRGALAPPPTECIANFDQALSAALHAPLEDPLPIVIESEAVQGMIVPPANTAFEPGQLQDALECPFRFVARDILQLHANRSFARYSKLGHLPQRAELTIQPDRASAEAALRLSLDHLLETIYAEVDEWETRLLRSAGERLIREWLTREFRARETWPKESLKLNARFGEDLKAEVPGNYRLRGTVPAVSTLGPYNIAHVYRRTAPENSNLSDLDLLYYGIHLRGLFESNRMPAVEVESQTGKRTLLILGREAGQHLRAYVQEGLQVIDLASSDDPYLSRKRFFDDVRDLLRAAGDRIAAGAIEAIPGEHCFYCSFGELCRRSQFFSEEESLFGRDDEPFT
jgi:hypothetical protein